jgi:hypothetical protein
MKASSRTGHESAVSESSSRFFIQDGCTDDQTDDCCDCDDGDDCCGCDDCCC